MAVPDIVPIRREAGYRTDTIGRYAAGQFFASVTGAFRGSLKRGPQDDEPMRWYSVLHLFDREGNHVRSDICFAGTAAEGERETVRRAEVHLSKLLDELPGHSYGDIRIRLFHVDFDGVVFGLIDDPEPERGDWVELYPDRRASTSPGTACTTPDRQVRLRAQHVHRARHQPGTTRHQPPRANRAAA